MSRGRTPKTIELHQEITRLLALNKTYREIAQLLNLTASQANHHINEVKHQQTAQADPQQAAQVAIRAQRQLDYTAIAKALSRSPRATPAT